MLRINKGKGKGNTNLVGCHTVQEYTQVGHMYIMELKLGGVD